MVNVISVLTAILTLLAGIGVFLVACTMIRTCCRPPHQRGEDHSGLTINNSLTLFKSQSL